MTYMQAALTILAHADYPLTVGELTAVAIADGLIRPRGQTPDRTMSSVLYRRMAGDPDAPIISRGARFWLRGRPLPEAEASYLSQRARRAHSAGRRRQRTTHRESARRVSLLPPPPLRLPAAALAAVAAPSPAAPYAPTRRERAIARAAERGTVLLARLEDRRATADDWDVARTETRLVAPLLAHLGYRRGKELARLEQPGRGATGYVLSVAGLPTIALLVRRLAHDLHDDDVWRALSQARQIESPYAAVTNGRELRLYAVSMAEAHDDPAAALVVTLDLSSEMDDGEQQAAQGAALWLLSRNAVASGALDAYAADRAVGAALLDALDAADSPLARALVADVRARTGLALPAETVLRHARLVVRGRRGRDGEPVPADVATVAAVRGPRLTRPALPVVAVARSA